MPCEARWGKATDTAGAVIADPENRLSVQSQITLLDEAAKGLNDDCIGFTLAHDFDPRQSGCSITSWRRRRPWDLASLAAERGSIMRPFRLTALAMGAALCVSVAPFAGHPVLADSVESLPVVPGNGDPGCVPDDIVNPSESREDAWPEPGTE